MISESEIHPGDRVRGRLHALVGEDEFREGIVECKQRWHLAGKIQYKIIIRADEVDRFYSIWLDEFTQIIRREPVSEFLFEDALF